METSIDLIPLDSSSIRRYMIEAEWLYNMDDIIEFFKDDAVFYKQWWRNYSQKRDERGYSDMIRSS